MKHRDRMKHMDREKVIEKWMRPITIHKMEDDVKGIIGTWRFPRIHAILRNILRTRKRILNAGSGRTSLGPNVVNMDLQKYPNVHIVADISERIPAQGSSFDAVVCWSVLEHLRNPQRAVDEMYRVLKKGGVILASSPFMFKYHQSPYDYQRFTPDGLEELFSKFEKIESGQIIGPTNALRALLANYCTLYTFSSNAIVNNAIRSLVFLVTWPLRYLDLLLVKNRESSIIAGSFYYYARKA